MTGRRFVRVVGVALAAALALGACSDDDPPPPPPEPSAATALPTPPPASPPETSAPPSTPTALPPITVEHPANGDEISSPVIVSGTADVFEATVSMRILDTSGNVLVRGFTTATCGTGCRGDYSKKLRFEVTESQPGIVEVWWDSPKDGSRQDVVPISVLLTP